MKTKVAMAISLSGVLAAGTAAALVNTQVLNGGSSGGPLAAAVDARETIPGSSGTSAGTPSTNAAFDAPVDARSPTQATYAIADAGTVTLDTADGMLSIVDATPAPGWVVSQAETDDSANAEVKFRSGDLEVEFHANLLYGVVTTSVESNGVSGDDVSGDDGSSDEGAVSGQGSDDDGNPQSDDGDHHDEVDDDD